MNDDLAGASPVDARVGRRTTVNAGFSRTLIPPARRRYTREWCNVQGIVIEMPSDTLGSREFRDQVRRHAPPGIGWLLEGYAVAEAKRPNV